MRLTCDPCSWAVGVSWRDFVAMRDDDGRLSAIVTRDKFFTWTMLTDCEVRGRIVLAVKVQLLCLALSFNLPTCVVLVAEVGELSRRTK